MTIKHIIWIVAALFGVAIVIGVLYVFFAPKAVPQVSEPATTLPGSAPNNLASSTSGTTPPGDIGTMTVAAQDGSSVTVLDFIHNGVTISDKVNAGSYMLAGNLGYCLSDPQQCQAAPADNFNVFYNSAPQSFNIVLTKEPIGQARLDMEQFMLTTLGITQRQLCGLKYRVGVTSYVSEQYTARNLGFSFCPGATVLPK